ncbi:MAG TPA: acyl-CoA dehydrogenase, partial [Mycobacterium sp.]
MDFGLTEEQDQLAAAERAWLSKNDPIARVRATLDAAAVTVDPAAVAHAVESGFLELLTPEIGGTHVDLAVVSEEHGYAMSSLPVADLNVVAWLLDHVDSPAEDGKLTGLALGPDATLDGDALRLTGVTRPVPMAADTDSIAVAGQVGGDEYLVVLNAPRL